MVSGGHQMTTTTGDPSNPNKKALCSCVRMRTLVRVVPVYTKSNTVSHYTGGPDAEPVETPR